MIFTDEIAFESTIRYANKQCMNGVTSNRKHFIVILSANVRVLECKIRYYKLLHKY